MISLRSLAGVSAALVFAAQPAMAQTSKVDRAVVESLRAGKKTQRVIVSVVPGSRAEIRKALEKHGDKITADLPSVNALTVELHSEDVAELAKHHLIKSIAANSVVTAGAAKPVAPSTTPAAPNTLRETLGLPRAATSTTPSGMNVGVAIIDSGIAPTQDFAGRITAFYDFTQGGIPTGAYDDYGHGTHVAGLIGSSGVLSDNQFQGVAPNVTFVGLKVLDANGQGTTSDVIRAIEFVTANKDLLRVQVINLSLGHPIFAPAKDDPMVQAVERASAAGLIVVCSAGNYGQNQATGVEGYTGLTSPGNAPSAITAGSANTQNTVSRGDDVVASYSSRGPSWYDAFAKPNVVAPGHHLLSDTTSTSTLFVNYPALRKTAANGRTFLELSGSSMAAAVTTGAVAVIIDAHNRANYAGATPLSANAIKAMLEFSALPIANADYLTQGAGEINAAGAAALASAIDTSAAPGTWWLRSGVPALTSVGGQVYAWGQNIVWGDNVLTGDLLYSANTAWSASMAWGSNIVWESSTQLRAANIVWGNNVVWGNNIVWGNRIIGLHDGDNIVWGNSDGDNIVWGNLDGDNIVWDTWDGDNIVWGTWDGDNIVWGTMNGDNIVWGNAYGGGDNIVWGTAGGGDNIVWGNATVGGKGGVF